MAVYRGSLFAGTLPSGRVLSMEAGRLVTWDTAFPSGWRHVAAVRCGSRLALHVDGRRVAVSAPFERRDYHLGTTTPLRIGFGPGDYFAGRMSDLRLYARALAPREIALLAGC
jgi:hypothetical protein